MLLPVGLSGMLLCWKPPLPVPLPAGPSSVLAQEGWKIGFDELCSKTDVAMALSVGELKERIARCVELKGRIESQDGPARKVYLRRLKMCCDFYEYVLEDKERGR